MRRRPPEGEPPWLRVISSQFSPRRDPSPRKPFPTGKVILGTAGLTAIVGAAIYLGSHDNRPSQLPKPTPIAGPAIPGATTEQEKQAIPIELQLLMQEAGYTEKALGGQNIREWRNSLPDGTIVRTTFYPEGILGVVDPDKGAKKRFLPTTRSFWFGGGIAWGDQVGSEQYPPRFKITIGYLDGTSEEWLGIESYLHPTNDRFNYINMTFVAVRTEEDGKIITITKESPNPVTVDWPRPQ